MGLQVWFENAGREQFQQALDCYDDKIRAKKPNFKGVNLQELDQWWREELPKTLSARNPPYLTKEEALKVSKWKFSRGSRRPNIMNQNEPSAVEEATKAAYSSLPDASAAMKNAEVLRGVGPSTATAILSPFSQDIPFMSDEALEACGLAPRKFTVPIYLKMRERLMAKAAELGEPWTAELVQRALWACSAMKERDINLPGGGGAAAVAIEEEQPRQMDKKRKAVGKAGNETRNAKKKAAQEEG